jgi:hypothetical protein
MFRQELARSTPTTFEALQITISALLMSCRKQHRKETTWLLMSGQLKHCLQLSEKLVWIHSTNDLSLPGPVLLFYNIMGKSSCYGNRFLLGI